MIKCISSGLVYRNPRPELRAVHAWHPSIVAFDDGELVATFDLGQGPESLDYATYVSRSLDGGNSWQEPQRMFAAPPAENTTHSLRVSRLKDGRLTGLGGLFHRAGPDEGLINQDNLGYCPMNLVTAISSDRGRTWSAPAKIDPPLVGPAFEACSPIRELSDGRWLAPMSTWKGRDGAAPNGMQAVALVSHDQGRTWPEYMPIMNGYDQGVIHWEQSLAELPGGRLLVVAWAYHEPSGETRPSPYAIAVDGKTFSPARLTGYLGQTAKILCLADGRILCLYRSNDGSGLRGCLARIDGEQWITLSDTVLWDGAPSGMEGKGPAGAQLSALRFGYPSLVQLASGEVFAVFWCSEDCINNIRWLRLAID